MFIVIDSEWQDDIPEVDIEDTAPLHYDFREAIAYATARRNARIERWNEMTDEEQEALLDEGYDAPDAPLDFDEETDF